MVRWLLIFMVLIGGAGAAVLGPLYQQVVTTPAQSVVQLRRATKQYLAALDKEKPKKQRGQWHANADSTQFTFTADFLLYNRKAVKHPLGQITYRTRIDLKQGKYRYTADSAFFHEYQRNRYSRYVPSRRAAVAWEQAVVSFSDKEQQRVHQTLDARFEAFQEFMQSYGSLSTASPEESDW